MTIGALLIHPADSRWKPSDPEQLRALLEEIGLTGASVGGAEPARYRTGTRFLDHVTFLGCAPSIELEPTADGRPYCHVRLATYPDGARLIRGDTRRPPRCRYCRALQPDWTPDPNTVAWRCPACGRELNLGALEWGRSAGVARCFVIVANVFPSEAVPSQHLLDALATATGVTWSYFYADVED